MTRPARVVRSPMASSAAAAPPRRAAAQPFLAAAVRSFAAAAGVSSLKVPWRRDPILDAAIERDKKWRLCSRVVREVLNEPGGGIALRYLEKRRERLRLPVRVKTFLSRNPLLFDLYQDRLRPTAEPVPFLRASTRLTAFLREEQRVRSANEGLAVAKLCKLLMMSKHKVLSSEKLLHVKRDFGFPDDFLSSLVPRYPHRLRLSGGGAAGPFVELVGWDEELAQSAVERRAAEETRLTGVAMRANFELRFPRGFSLRREMREWTREWLELPYVSPYADAGELRPASPEMEKRMVGLLHEFLSLTVLRRAAVPTVGKFAEEFSLSNAFSNAFTRHPGIFYLSLKGGVETAVLREAYGGDGELTDRDPLLEIKDMFEELLEEGHRQWVEQQRTSTAAAATPASRDRELLASAGQLQ